MFVMCVEPVHIGPAHRLRGRGAETTRLSLRLATPRGHMREPHDNLSINEFSSMILPAIWRMGD